jgi:hypothetical protein
MSCMTLYSGSSIARRSSRRPSTGCAGGCRLYGTRFPHHEARAESALSRTDAVEEIQAKAGALLARLVALDRETVARLVAAGLRAARCLKHEALPLP